nr:Chain A, CARBOXYLIC ESTER HYDROLASE [Hungatella hathewayi DSM 13479]5A2G_B Chain B, CARBOXYLIC ESTER HYDROLASE [Hungatella hathewayi DSM 13479]5A2G_C Chain C, CARBOXYLIC ESTER HYDROLASE [Hungatella hathewayi DSM 13479]5A2G_D Chain D, CARBOXYLIC ESTER HYDROLASE [Hungatella hathewayi DSM 13479]
MAKQFLYDNLPVVETKAGKLRGYQWEGTYIFKGIRYARANRFQLPEEVEPWEGVKEAASYGFVCPMLTRDHPQGELLVPHRYWPQDEDCLSLNIWSQSLDRSAKKPVMFWIHGGAFSMGSSIEQKAYNGENMSRYGDVVVVTVNHRLNILGYLDLSPYGERYAGSANAGQADLVAALKWVRDNIEAFGGDPDNVTIFGQSGGGMKVSGLMQTPEADGLFHRAMIMSGVAGDVLPYSTGDSRPLIQAMLKELGLAEQEAGRLETVPYYDLAAAYNRVSPAIARAGGYIGCTPRPDDFYKGEGPAVGFTDHAKTIPVMVGTVFGEFAMMPLPFNKETISEAELDEILDKRFQGHGKELKTVFAEAYPGKSPVDLLTLDTIFRGPTKEFVRSLAAAGGSVYSYLFALEFPYQNQKTAWHCSDIPFIFHNTELVPVTNIPEISDKLEKQMFDAVIHFVETGDPNHLGIPQWPVSTEDREATMIFDRVCTVRFNFDDYLLELYKKALPNLTLANITQEDNQIQHALE